MSAIDERNADWYRCNTTHAQTELFPEYEGEKSESRWYVICGIKQKVTPPGRMLLLLGAFSTAFAVASFICSYPVTLGIMGANTLVFCMLQSRKWKLEEVATSFHLTMKERQFYRLISSGFSHQSHLHFFVNMMSLFNLGNLVERMLGSRAYGACYLAILLAGGTASSFVHRKKAPNELSLGASGAICGLLGIILIYALYYGAAAVLQYVITTLMLLVLMLRFKRIDHVGHFCGFAAGIAAAVVMIEWPLWTAMLGS